MTSLKFVNSAGMPQAQIIGLLKNRLSGIVLSRHAYADVLRTIYHDLRDTTTEQARATPCRVNVWAARPMSQLVLDEYRQRLPGFQIWCLVVESTTLPDGSLEACRNVDQVWVPTTFVRDVCVRAGMPSAKVRVVPYWLPYPGRPARASASGTPWTALISWDGRSSINRKNVVMQIEAFREAFPNQSDVRLVLKTRDLSPENQSMLQAIVAQDSRVVLDTRTLDTIDEIYDGADTLLHCHRAEGYGRHVVEAMQRRVPVITTAYSGVMDWVAADNCLLVSHNMVATQQNEFQYPQGGAWAEPRKAEIVRQLQIARGWRNNGMLDRAELAALKATNFERARAAMTTALTEGGVL